MNCVDMLFYSGWFIVFDLREFLFVWGKNLLLVEYDMVYDRLVSLHGVGATLTLVFKLGLINENQEPL